MQVIQSVFIILLIAISPMLKADSPITSTDFHTFYMDVPMVKYAKETKKMDDKIARFLCSKKVKLVEKAAVINAISWGGIERNNASLFMAYVTRTHPKNAQETNNKSKRDIQFCYGYLMAMDDYFNVEKAAAIMVEQEANYTKSYTAQMVIALVKAQKAFSGNWCAVWQLADKVDTNTKLKADMKPEARKIIMDYMVLYKDSCP